MTQSTLQSRQSERGFTLVELAIVMIIIGLLIGGILKGQELINNARVSSTVAQAKAIESGISAFRDKYAGIPGDILTPTTRIPGCTAAQCIIPGNGDGAIANGAFTVFNPGAIGALGTESTVSFVHLAAAGMLGGVNGNATVLQAGQTHPSLSIAGVWQLGTSTGALATGLVGPTLTPATALQSGIYAAVVPAPGTAAGAGPLTPIQSANIDRKLDDGNPNGGIVRATGVAGGCADVNTEDGVYNENLTTSVCGLYVKVQ
ncbi:MAG: prepilin-type N-terminal cleavage/methylation domain-containing protein [Pseudomonadota bacterium]